jgi:SAM-dependent methyltransferase
MSGSAINKAFGRVAFGADPLVAIEPDNRLADFLCETIHSEALTVIRSTFEDAVLRGAGFDLGFSATAFHWLDEETALKKVAGLLRPGGWWVMVWNDFGDPDREAVLAELGRIARDDFQGRVTRNMVTSLYMVRRI